MCITPRLQITLRHWSELEVPGHSVSPFTLLASSKQSQADVEYQSPAPLLQGRTISDMHSCVLSSHGHRLSVGFLKSHPHLASSHFLSFIPTPFLISPGSPKSQINTSRSLTQGLLLQEQYVKHSLTLQMRKIVYTVADSLIYLENHFK